MYDYFGGSRLGLGATLLERRGLAFSPIRLRIFSTLPKKINFKIMKLLQKELKVSLSLN